MRGTRLGAAVLVVGVLAAVAVAVVLVVVRPWSDAPANSDVPTATPADAVAVLAVGDIARGDSDTDEATAALVRQVPDAVVLALGDLVYPDGTAHDFAQCYDPSWGVPDAHAPRSRQP